MTRQQRQWFLALGMFYTLLSSVTPAHAATGELKLVALAKHRETGRDIYLGALHAQQLVASPADIASVAGARGMEFRIAARRTSIRSVLGGILLQAEVARGVPPGPAIVEFADAIMSSVRGSLYAGDSFRLLHAADGSTEASVDDQVMARTDAEGVFDYFLSGWVDERGASTAFRRSLLAEDIDVGLRADYMALTPGPDRAARVAAWTAPAPRPAEKTPAPEVQSGTPQSGTRQSGTRQSGTRQSGTHPSGTAVAVSEATSEPNTGPEPSPAAAQAVATPAEAEPEVSREDSAEARTMAEAQTMADAQTVDAAETRAATETPAATAMETAAEAAAPGEQGGVDSIPSLAVAGTMPVQAEDNSTAELVASATDSDPFGLESMGVIEYSQRLAQFNTMVFRMVNSKIRYPRAAVRRNIQGDLELDVTLDQQGALLDVSVARTSGHSMLDESALRAARLAFDAPLGQPLDQVAVAEYADQDKQLVIPVPVNFVLTE